MPGEIRNILDRDPVAVEIGATDRQPFSSGRLKPRQAYVCAMMATVAFRFAREVCESCGSASAQILSCCNWLFSLPVLFSCCCPSIWLQSLLIAFNCISRKGTTRRKAERSF